MKICFWNLLTFSEKSCKSVVNSKNNNTILESSPLLLLNIANNLPTSPDRLWGWNKSWGKKSSWIPLLEWVLFGLNYFIDFKDLDFDVWPGKVGVLYYTNLDRYLLLVSLFIVHDWQTFLTWCYQFQKNTLGNKGNGGIFLLFL